MKTALYGRMVFGAATVVFGVIAQRYGGSFFLFLSLFCGAIALYAATEANNWMPPHQIFWAILTTFAFGLAAVAILINHQARLAMRLMTLMLALFGVMVWIPHVMAHPKAHFNWSECALTFLVTGAAWMAAELKPF